MNPMTTTMNQELVSDQQPDHHQDVELAHGDDDGTASCGCCDVCCTARLGALGTNELASIPFAPLDDALALRGDGGLPLPFSALPPCQGGAWFGWCRVLRVLEPPCASFNLESAVKDAAPSFVGCFGYGLLALLKTPPVAGFVALGYLLPSQLAFFANYPRFAARVVCAVGGCAHWSPRVRLAALSLLPVPLLCAPALQLFGCLWVWLGLTLFEVGNFNDIQ